MKLSSTILTLLLPTSFMSVSVGANSAELVSNVGGDGVFPPDKPKSINTYQYCLLDICVVIQSDN